MIGRSKWLVGALVAAGLLLAAGGRPAAAGGELSFYGWANWFPPALAARFEKETGIRVTVEGYDGDEVLLARLRAGGARYDVVVPGDTLVETLIAAGLLQPIDAPSMANFARVSRRFADPWYDPGRRYSAPYLWGTVGFTYDSAKVPGGRLEDSWKEFFTPRPELAGKVAALDDRRELYRAAAFYLGIDPCTADPGAAQQILDLLLAQKPKLALYDSDGSSERLIAGTVALHQQWNGDAHRTRLRLPTAVYVYPREGVGTWQDSLAVPRGAPHPDNARVFINWMMAPDVIAAASDFTGYANAIDGAERFMDKALVADPAIALPAAAAGRLRDARNCSTAAQELGDKVWARLRN